LLSKIPAADLDRLFAEVRAAERQMGVTEAVWPKRTFTLQQVDFLNRSPQYPIWRKAVSGVFAEIDPLLDAETARHGRPRVVVVLSPSEIPAGPDRLWTRVRNHGRRIPLETPSDCSRPRPARRRTARGVWRPEIRCPAWPAILAWCG
jgi:hypothetical protein